MATLKVPNVEGMARSTEEGCGLRNNSFSYVTATAVAASSMLSCS
jgi:hypothetical protein